MELYEAAALLIVVVALALIYTKFFQEKETFDNNEDGGLQEDTDKIYLEKLQGPYKTVKTPIPESEEKHFKIEKMFVYPIRGTKALPTDYLEVGPHGVKYDREFVFIYPVKNKPVTASKNQDVACLTQSMDGWEVLITTERPDRLDAKGLPRALTLATLNTDPEMEETNHQGLVEVNKSYSGYKQSDKINEWFSDAIG